MAYEETPAEKQKRQNKESENAARGKAAEAKQDYEVFGSRGDAARKGMEEGRMDAMGTAYKKGGKVSSASKRADGCCVKGKTKGKYL